MEHDNCFPDGTPIDPWFFDTSAPTVDTLGARYVLTDHGVTADDRVQTTEIQSLIDRIAENGGGVLVVPAGRFLTGALFFKQGVHLHIEKGGLLLGSDNIADYPVCDTRIEGESCRYFPALINADGLDGFTVTGEGVIDGNGLRSWTAFWIRREWNPDCTNKDEQRPRLLYLSHCRNATVAGVTLQNSAFWTCHLYRCERVRILSCRITSPVEPVPAPSTDAIDIDVCTDVLIKGCYMSVNDDSVVLKGGKGPWADTAPENGSNERILVEDCTYGHCHGCLTCGSESVHNHNVLVRRLRVEHAYNLLWLKMRPDTPQHYEYITVEDAQGTVNCVLYSYPYTQFFSLKGRKDIPLSTADHVTLRRLQLSCDAFVDMEAEPSQTRFSDFSFSGMQITAQNPVFPTGLIERCSLTGVVVNGQEMNV